MDFVGSQDLLRHHRQKAVNSKALHLNFGVLLSTFSAGLAGPRLPHRNRCPQWPQDSR